MSRCALCRKPLTDPLYVGPAGHCPPGIDFDCWVEYWEDRPGVDWSVRTFALWLLAVGGFTQREAGAIAGVSPRTIRRWLRRLRGGREEIFDLLSEMRTGHVRQARSR